MLNPSLWYEFHVCGKLNARGVACQVSGIIIGWTGMSPGVTALGDQADMFRLKTDAEHPNQYSIDGRWLAGGAGETIRSKTADPWNWSFEIRTLDR